MDNEDPTTKTGREPVDQSKNTQTSEAKPSQNPDNKPPARVAKLRPKNVISWFKGLNRNAKLALVLTATLVVVGVFAVILSSDDSTNNEDYANDQSQINEATEKTESTISLREGTLEYKDESGEWVDAPEDLKPTEGTMLRTIGATSRAVVVFSNSSELRIDANSEAEIKTQNAERVVIKHINGYTYNRVVTSDNFSYIVETENAQYESEGTAFKTNSTGDEQAVEVYQSTVHETTTNKKPKEGEKLTVKNEINPSKDGEIVKIDIEVVKKDLFMTWNRNLDIQNENFKNDLGILKDFDGPEIAIDNPADGSTVLLEPDATEGATEFSGKTEKGSSLTVQSKSQAGSQAIKIDVGAEGNFVSPVITAPLGSSVFEFVAKDRNGNTTTKNIRVNFQKKSAPISTNGTITLSLSNAGNDVKAQWDYSAGYLPENGVKIVYSKSANPTYGSGATSEFSNGKSQTVIFNPSQVGETYYFRICDYDPDSNTCTNYSNQESIKIKS
jgi:hypothetical protein